MDGFTIVIILSPIGTETLTLFSDGLCTDYLCPFLCFKQKIVALKLK